MVSTFSHVYWLTSAVSCRWASFAAPKCWVSSSFSTAYYRHRTKQDTVKKNTVSSGIFSTDKATVDVLIPAWPFSAGLLSGREGVWSPPAVWRRHHSSWPAPQTEMKSAGWNYLEGSTCVVIRRWNMTQKAVSLQFESETAVGEYAILNSMPAVSPVLTQFFNAVIDELLLFFLIGDSFCLQVTGLKHDQSCQLFIYMMVSLQTPSSHWIISPT